MSKRSKLLDRRLMNFEGPNYSPKNRTTLFDFYLENPQEAVKVLNANIVVDGKTCVVKDPALFFNYEWYMNYLGLKVKGLIGYKDGLVFELK